MGVKVIEENKTMDNGLKPLILDPKWLQGRELAFETVEKDNRKRLEGIERARDRQRHHTFFPKAKVCTVAVSDIDGEKMLCFCGDGDAELWVSGITIKVKERFVLPVREVVTLVNRAYAHPGLSKQLSEIYALPFKLRNPPATFMLSVKKAYSDREILGAALFRILEEGKSEIPREWNSFNWLNAKEDKPFQMLCKKARAWMKKNKFDPYE